MFCATCFQTAEEGSKYCSGCRRVRESQSGQEAVAWSVLPEAPAEAWALNVKSDGPPTQEVAPRVAPAWEEGNVWTPPPPSENSEQGPGHFPGSPPRAQVACPASDEAVGNPFGEPPDDALSLYSSEAPELEEPEVETATIVHEPPPVADPLGQQGSISIQPFRARGNGQITAMLLVGFLLLSVTAVGQVFRQPAEDGIVAAQAETPVLATSDDSTESAQRFLASAKASMEGQDFELAASQLKKAIQEMEAANASEPEVEAARLLLARATFAEGQLEFAQNLCAQLGQGSVKVEAAELSSQIQKELRKEAQNLLASARQDLQAGRLTPALQKARNAKALFMEYGGSAQQVRAAKLLIARADRAAAGLGLERARRLEPATTAQTPARRPQVRPQRPRAYPRPRPAQQPPLTVPQAGGPEPRTSEVSPASLPMAKVMRRQQRPPSVGQTAPPSNPEGQAAPVPAQTSAAQGPARLPSAPTSRRSRAGSNDVLPTYNSQGGGSAY